MECPYCHKKQTRGEDRVLDTWETPDMVNTYRRRRCSKCGKVFRTVERIHASKIFGNLTVKVH